jgi:membrane fusion protein (multidrug efflux system)
MAEESLDARACAPEKSLLKRKRFRLPLAFVLIAAALVLSYWFFYLRGYVSTNNAFIDGDPVTISSKVLGRVVQLTADEGDTTRQGELLVQLDDSDLRAQRTQSEAGLAYTEQNVSLAKINIERAREDFSRASMQYGDNVITREQYDHTRQALQVAEAQYRVALSQVGTSRAQIGVVETQMKNSSIVAPIAGVIARKWVVPGDIVQPGQPILTIYDLDSVWVTANFEETKLGSVRLNDAVRISVDAYPGVEFEGRVRLIGAAAASQFSLIPPNNASGNFTKVAQRVPVKISIESKGSERNSRPISLLPGMSAEVKIRVNSTPRSG